MKVLKKSCKAIDNKFDSLANKCTIIETGKKIAALVSKGQYRKVKAMLKKRVPQLIKPENGCVPFLLAKLSGRGKLFQGCSCSMFFGSILNTKYTFGYPEERNKKRNIRDAHHHNPTWMNPFNPSQYMRRSPREHLQLVDRPTARIGPIRVVLERKLQGDGTPVCRMFITTHTLECQTPAGVNWKTKTACGCTGGLMSRRIQTGQIPVKATDNLHSTQIKEAQCGEWFIVMDGTLRATYAGMNIFTLGGTSLGLCARKAAKEY